MKKDIIIVNTNTMNVYSFVGFMIKNETPKEALKRAIESNKKDIKTWENNILIHGTCEKFENYLKQHKQNKFEIMTYEKFEKLERENILSKPLHEITEEQFNEMLNVLPPMKWYNNSHISMFLMSEFYTASYTSQYCHDKINNKFYSKMVDAFNNETWIDKIIQNN